LVGGTFPQKCLDKTLAKLQRNRLYVEASVHGALQVGVTTSAADRTADALCELRAVNSHRASTRVCIKLLRYHV